MTSDALLMQLQESLGDDVEALILIVELVEMLARRRLAKKKAA